MPNKGFDHYGQVIDHMDACCLLRVGIQLRQVYLQEALGHLQSLHLSYRNLIFSIK